MTQEPQLFTRVDSLLTQLSPPHVLDTTFSFLPVGPAEFKLSIADVTQLARTIERIDERTHAVLLAAKHFDRSGGDPEASAAAHVRLSSFNVCMYPRLIV